LVGVLGVALLGATPAAPQDDLEGLAWLEGEWQRETRRGLSIERWSRLPDGGLVGESVVIPADGGAEFQVEALLLVRMGADIFYVARPRQNELPIGFRLVAQTDTEAVFENPTHDFPQRITYQRTAPDAFTATIVGPGDDGEPQEITFHFTRAGGSAEAASVAPDAGRATAQAAPAHSVRLDFMVGRWRIDARIKNGPESYLEGAGTMDVRWDGVGTTLLADMRVAFANFEVNGVTRRVFNADADRWDISWNPTVEGRPVVPGIEGKYQDGRFIEINYGQDANGAFIGRLAIFDISNDHFSVRKDRLYDDGTLRPEIWVYEAIRVE